MADRPPRLSRVSRSSSPPAVEGALRAGEDAGRRRRLRAWAAGAAALVLLAGGLFALERALRPGYVDHLRAERKGWNGIQFVGPQDERVDPATGEVMLPYDGFGVWADSEPEGARVMLGGRVLGETPIGTAVACKAGDPVTLRFEKAGHPAKEVTTRCRENAMVKIKVALRR